MDNKLLLLGLLRRQEMHGYGLNEFIDRQLAFCTDLKKPTAYFLLNKLASDGWIAEEQVQAGNRPTRRVYRLTEEGEAAYQRLLRENLCDYSPIISPGDIGLAFVDSLEPLEAIALLQQRRKALVGHIESIMDAPEHQGSPAWVLEHQRRYLSCELEWLDEIISKLKEKI